MSFSKRLEHDIDNAISIITSGIYFPSGYLMSDKKCKAYVEKDLRDAIEKILNYHRDLIGE